MTCNDQLCDFGALDLPNEVYPPLTRGPDKATLLNTSGK
jgi:hypothetical protein